MVNEGFNNIRRELENVISRAIHIKIVRIMFTCEGMIVHSAPEIIKKIALEITFGK